MLHDLIPGLIIAGVLVVLIVFSLGYMAGLVVGARRAEDDGSPIVLPPPTDFGGIDRTAQPWWKS